jgi:hypothetical protein
LNLLAKINRSTEKYNSLLKRTFTIIIGLIYLQLTDHANVPWAVDIIIFMLGFPETWKLFQGFLQGKNIEKGWPSGFQSKTLFSKVPSCFLNVFPIHHHFLSLICVSIYLSCVILESSSFQIISGRLTFRMRVKHLLTKIIAFWNVAPCSLGVDRRFITSWATVGFSTSTILHGNSWIYYLVCHLDLSVLLLANVKRCHPCCGLLCINM